MKVITVAYTITVIKNNHMMSKVKQSELNTKKNEHKLLVALLYCLY